MKIIALITDFGYNSPYIGSVKAKIESLSNEKVSIIDVFHDIENFNIFSSIYWIYFLYRDYPEETVFLCIVDPTVGTERKGLVLFFENRFFVGPDNGIFTLLIKKGGTAYELPPPPEKASPTFHARDYFSIWATKISNTPFILKALKKLENPKIFEIKEPIRTQNEIKGKAILKDKFGNILTDIPNEWLIEKVNYVLKINNFVIEGPKRTYADVKRGELLFLRGSFGFVEIASNMESAFDIINSTLPTEIIIKEKIKQ
ncbi:MAG: SAM-dependent chlorinase/fluorinase [Candidatus Hydrothermales bacterium]